MNRNVESHFAELPQSEYQRSIFDRSSDHKTSLNVGELVPFYIDEILPGDSAKITTSKVLRLQTLLTPVMDNLYADFYWFYCPDIILWDHTKQFFGENTESAWVPTTEYQIPAISSPVGGFDSGTIADYMGLPVGVEWSATDLHAPSALPFRAYAMICDQFFRDQNVTDPLYIPTGDANQTGSNGGNYIYDVVNGGKPFKVARYHDYFSSCLPNAQKAVNAVTVPLPEFPGGNFAVHTGPANEKSAMISNGPMTWYTQQYNSSAGEGESPWSDYSTYKQPSYSKNTYTNPSNYMSIQANGDTLENSSRYWFPANLSIDIPETSIGSFSINDLRLAFSLQRYFERNARSGSRYQEYLLAQYGVHSPDATLYKPQYLGGNRVPITIHEVLNNAQSEQDFLGDLGAMSVTADIHDDVVQSFTQHGYILGLVCVRYDNTYTQGLERFWSRKRTTDFYTPVFANLGEQPVMSCEIYATSETINNNDVFGFNEAWSEYRFKPSRCSSEMRPGVSNTLASWHFADYYTQQPTLSDEWMRVDKTNVDRVLAVTSQVSNQIFADIYTQCFMTRVMPMYSIPGLIDHN